jgi:hypothetical protein
MMARGKEKLCLCDNCPASHKVVPHRRLLIRAVASDIFGADQSTVLKLDA